MTPTLAPGPQITFFGLARADGTVLEPSSFTPEGDPVYNRVESAVGGAFGFLIVAEARAGANSSPPGNTLLNSNPIDPGARPDLQIQADRALGNGSAEVCDKVMTGPDSPPGGGVPGIDPESFDPSSQMVADALNDFACRFKYEGASSNSCALSAAGNPRFVSTQSTDQFCSDPVVDFAYRFPVGDTTLTVRWRDLSGVLGPPARFVIRVN